MRKSTMEPIQYLLAHLYWGWLLCILFMTQLFTPIISIFSGTFMTVRGSLVVLLGTVIICVIFGIFATIKNYRNNLYLALNLLSPYGIYLIFETLPKLPPYFWCGLFVWLATVLYGACKVILTPVRNTRNTHKIIFRRICRFMHNSRFIFTALLAVFTVVCITASVFGVSVVDAGKNRTYDVSKKMSYVLNDYEIELRRFDPDSWDDIPLEQKVEALQLVVDIETAYLGLPDRITVCAEELDVGVLGAYRHSERRIFINEDLLNVNFPGECLDTILHEVYHSYQHHLCDLYGRLDDRYRSMIHIRDASTYFYEFSNYSDGCDNFIKYLIQLTEQDARSYAKTRFQQYKVIFNKSGSNLMTD